MIHRKPPSDSFPMPWGPHKGVPMGKLPIDHLIWLREQPWLRDWPTIWAYVDQQKERIEAVLRTPPSEGEDSPPTFATFEDYLRWKR